MTRIEPLKLPDGLTPGSVHAPYLGQFPYLGVPYSGYSNPSVTPVSVAP